MAFQALVNGSDCGPSNPLQNLLKNSERDPQSSRFDGLSHSRTAQFRNLGHQNQDLPNQSEFGSVNRPHGFFDLTSISNELDRIHLSRNDAAGPSNQQAMGWSSQFLSKNPSISTSEFDQMEHHFRTSSGKLGFQNHPAGTSSSQWTQQFSLHSNQASDFSRPVLDSPYSSSLNLGFQSRMMFAPSMGLMPFQNISTQSDSILSPGQLGTESSIQKLAELDATNWEAEFAKFGLASEVSDTSQASSSTLNQTASQEESRTHLDSEQSNKDYQSTEEDLEADDEFMKSLEATWKNLASDLNSSSLTDDELSSWQNEFSSSELQPQESSTINVENVDDFIKNPSPYPFQADNPYLDHPDPFEEGQRLIISGEPLSKAALAFEAACFLDSQRGEAWRMLGETHAADEREQLAIKAFEKAVGCGGSDGQASWISLAICWVNEGQDVRAQAILERWLRGAYPELIPADSSQTVNDRQNPWSRHNSLVDKFIAAARAGPGSRQGVGQELVQGQVVDADVQVGLGVLFYSNTDYERAKDCFEAALSVNPNDFLLWNRLGATLSNGGQSEEAIEAYRKALELRPTFTRAIYNMGVSCLNIHCYKEAAEHLLAALSLHQKSFASKNSLGSSEFRSDDGDSSENLWYTLRRALICMERQDLADRAGPNSDVESFRADGFDF
ncbi:peroxisomal targeting signal receptor [Phakopsora pachyrhizi]|uniref:Peroxisomal targeting signal receptor n=1 Tax=Phakopsora pachyrhizi TaxID=170000 RepID=A0AAV0ATQ3_PHAPC|nr:peroxisomal targeting signal receptor [Phakopsora pachyrhizi]CAH7672153.1 peroxisomal targeting signal receptor [Phakopsora pachyrhizi]